MSFSDFPNIEHALYRTFERDMPDIFEVDDPRMGSEFPDEVTDDLLPFVRVERIGGPRTRLNDHPLVDIDVLARTRDDARSLAERISTLLFSYPGMVVVGSRGVKFDSVDNPRTPARVPFDDDTVRRYGATYQISVRR